MAICDALISASLDAQCAVPKRGFEKAAVIINRADIDMAGITYSTTEPNVVTALPLKSGKKGFKVTQPGKTPYTGSSLAGATGTYLNTIDKTISIVLPNNDRELYQKFVTPALNGEFVMVLEMKDKGADNKSAFVVYGLEQGLVYDSLSGDPYGDAAGGVVLTFKEEGAASAAIYLGDTYSAGQTIFDGLTA